MKISLLIFCLNEIEALKVVVPRIQPEWVDEVFIIDGGSSDGSIEFAEACGFRVYRQKSHGIIPAYREALEISSGDYVITFTPDNNMIPEKIPELVQKLREGYDMVIVSRYLQGAKSEDDTLVSGFGNWLFTAMVNLLFRSSYTDVLGFYRGFRKNLITELGIKPCVTIDTQLCIRCKKENKRVAEIPGDEPPRIGGASIRSIIGNGLMELFTIISEFLNLAPDTRKQRSRESGYSPGQL